MKSKLNKLLLLFAISILSYNLWAAPLVSHHAEDLPATRVPDPARCQRVLTQLDSEIFKDRKNLLKDAEAQTADPYWGRLSQALHTTSEDTLKRLFVGKERITFEDVDDLWWLAQGGFIKTKNDTLYFLTSLRDFMSDYREAFQGGEGSVFRIIESINQADQKRGYEAGPSVAVRNSDRTLRKAEEQLLIQAIQEGRGNRNASNRWYDKALNYFSPHYDRMVAILKANEHLRRIMQISAKVDEPTYDALARYDSQLQPEGRQLLEQLITNTSTTLDQARATIAHVYGRELSMREPLKIGDVRLREIYKRLSEAQPSAQNEEALDRAESELDVLDKVLAQMFERRNQGVRPMSDYHPTHLQIRYSQFIRETGQLSGQYRQINEASPKNSDYRVSASWTVSAVYAETTTRTVTKTRTNSDGETESYTDTETETEMHYPTRYMTGNFTLNSSYDQILNGEIQPQVSEVESQLPSASSNAPYAPGTLISATNSTPTITSQDSARIRWILKESEKARQIEQPLREFIQRAISIVDQIANHYPQNVIQPKDWEQIMKQLQDLKNDIEARRNSILSDYARWTAQQIQGQWHQDSESHFRSRNQKLDERYAHLLKRVLHFTEQVNRKMDSLSIQYNSPQYGAQLAELKKIKRRNRLQQGFTGALLAFSLMGGTISYHHVPEFKAFIDQKIIKVESGFQDLKISTPPIQKDE